METATDTLFDLSGDIAVVVGGAGRIGPAVCRALAHHGAEVVVADVNEEAASDVVEGIDGDATAVECDVTDTEDVDALFDAVREDHGAPDIAVTMAYPRDGTYGAPLAERTIEDWRRNVDAQLTSTFHCCQRAIEAMRAEGIEGSVVTFGSTYGVQSPDFAVYEDADMAPSPAHYSASKAGVLNLTRYLAAALGPEGIRVNAVSPGGVFDEQDPAFVERYEERTPLGRMADPEDIAGAVVYLASDAAAYVTGHNLVVDGGWTIQ